VLQKYQVQAQQKSEALHNYQALLLPLLLGVGPSAAAAAALFVPPCSRTCHVTLHAMLALLQSHCCNFTGNHATANTVHAPADCHMGVPLIAYRLRHSHDCERQVACKAAQHAQQPQKGVNTHSMQALLASHHACL
jgi:hypothetical protein